MRATAYPSVRARLGARPRGIRLAGPLLLLLSALAYLAWPYATLWRLDRALVSDDRAALAALIDLDAVRTALARWLDKGIKEAPLSPSDDFIDWLERGIRRDGTAILERRVSLEWVRNRLLARSPPGSGIFPPMTYAFFEGPTRFAVRLGEPGQSPMHLTLSLDGLSWRVTGLLF
jgi:hypothetical protein